MSLVCRRLGRRQLTVVALALGGLVAVVGMGASSSDRASGPSGPTVLARELTATAALVTAPHRGGAAYYDRVARDRAGAVAGFFPLYREAERVYAVDWRLLASIHRQETAFSTSPSTYHGLNPFGCCAGPMQFNVTNGPISTWKRYRRSFRDGRRPDRYPHRTRSHPSIYDDFDAIMAAGSLLSDSGASRSLDRGAWLAAYSYYGHDLFGITYANQVLARAEAWRRHGFCTNCGLDEGMLAEFDEAYGQNLRQQLIDAEPPRTKHKRAKLARDHKRKHPKRPRRRKRRRGSDDRAAERSPAAHRRPSKPPAAKRRLPTKPPPPAPATPPAAPPPADECPLIRKLLGCKPSPQGSPPQGSSSSAYSLRL